MAMQQKLVLQAKLSQKLILTPSLQQAIKLLPMSTLELAEMLNQEITENPLLEEEVEIPSPEETPVAESEEKTAGWRKNPRRNRLTIPFRKSTRNPFLAITWTRNIAHV